MFFIKVMSVIGLMFLEMISCQLNSTSIGNQTLERIFDINLYITIPAIIVFFGFIFCVCFCCCSLFCGTPVPSENSTIAYNPVIIHNTTQPEVRVEKNKSICRIISRNDRFFVSTLKSPNNEGLNKKTKHQILKSCPTVGSNSFQTEKKPKDNPIQNTDQIQKSPDLSNVDSKVSPIIVKKKELNEREENDAQDEQDIMGFTQIENKKAQNSDIRLFDSKDERSHRIEHKSNEKSGEQKEQSKSKGKELIEASQGIHPILHKS